MGFEQQLQAGMFSAASEKTFIDKLLGREDVKDIRDLVRKPKWTREDLLEVLYLLTSSESKLLNYGVWDRYVVLKFFVWLREFVKILEMAFDDKEERQKRILSGQLQLDQQTEDMYEDARRKMEHNVKFLIDLYLNIARTSLSIGATGFLEILKNKYEISYPQGTNPPQGSMEQPQMVRR